MPDRRPRMPHGVPNQEIPVRSVRIEEDLWQAFKARALDEDPPLSCSAVLYRFVSGYAAGDLSVPAEVLDYGDDSPGDFDHELDPFPTAPGLCGTCGEWHFRTAATH